MSGFNDLGPRTKTKIGLVEKGSKEGDPGTKEQDSAQSVFDPIFGDSQGYSAGDIASSILTHAPTGFSQMSFPGAMDPGTIVTYVTQEGSPGGIITGQVSSRHEGGEGDQGGGGQAANSERVQQLRKTTRNINSPPQQIQETKDRGATVRKPQETGEQHSLSMLDGLPIHGALFEMTGLRLPEIKDIPTAKQHNSEMQMTNMLGQLNGVIGSAMGMFMGLKSGKMNNSGIGVIPYDNKGKVPKGEVVPTGTTWTSNAIQSLTMTSAGPYKIPTKAGIVVRPMKEIIGVNQLPPKLKANTIIVPGTILTAKIYNPKLKAYVDANTLNTNKSLANSYIKLNTVNKKANLSNVIINLNKANVPHVAIAVKSLSKLIPGVELSQAGMYALGGVVHPPTYLQNAHDLLSKARSVDDLMNILKRLQYDTSLFGQDKLDRLEITRQTAWGTVTQTLHANGTIVAVHDKGAIAEMDKFSKLMTNTKSSIDVTNKMYKAIDYGKWAAGSKKPANSYSQTYLSYNLSYNYNFPYKQGSNYTTTSTKNGTTKTTGTTVSNTGLTSTSSVKTGAGTGISTSPTMIMNPLTGKLEPAVGTSTGNTSNVSTGTSGGTTMPSTGSGSGSGSSTSGIITQMMSMAQQGESIAGSMFGKSSGTVMDMFKRLHPGGEQNAKKLSEGLSGSDPSMKKIMEIAKQTLEGDPTNPSNYTKMG